MGSTERIQVAMVDGRVRAASVGPAFRRAQQAIDAEQQGQGAPDGPALLDAAGADQAASERLAGVLARGMLAVRDLAPVVGALPGGQSVRVDLQPDVPHEIGSPRRQGAGMRRGRGAGVEELDESVGGESPAFAAGLPARMLLIDVLEPGDLERRGQRGWSSALTLPGDPAQPGFMHMKRSLPAQPAQASQDSDEQAVAFSMADGGRSGCSALVLVVVFLDVCLFLLLCWPRVCVGQMTAP